MNIFQAANLANLAQTRPAASPIILRRTLADVRAKMEKGAELLSSKSFYLVRLPLNRLASPLRASAEDGPIIVDVNAEKLGKAPNGFYPKAIVVSGNAAFRKAYTSGDIMVPVWVGSLAAAGFEIKADHMMGADELRQKLQDELTLREGPIQRMGKIERPDATPWIVEVYPFEAYFIYRKDAKLWKQFFTVDEGQRNIGLSGTPREVIQQYAEKLAPSQRMEAAAMLHACACTPMVQAAMKCTGKPDCACAHCSGMKAAKAGAMKCATKGGKVFTASQMHAKFKAAVAGGYKPTMKTSSPPGWGGTVSHMKDHPDIDNPWALAWWMDKEGYEPHHKED